jgi:hypothetical protein
MLADVHNYDDLNATSLWLSNIVDIDIVDIDIVDQFNNVNVNVDLDDPAAMPKRLRWMRRWDAAVFLGSNSQCRQWMELFRLRRIQ